MSPTKRRRRMRPVVPQELAPELRHVLMTGELAKWDGAQHMFKQILLKPRDAPCRRLWRQWRESLLAAWVAEHPGTRPWAWWQFDAPRIETIPAGREIPAWIQRDTPEPSQRLGGRGTPCYEVLPWMPELPFGIPTPWQTASQEEYFDDFVGEAFDPDDPPRYESEARYLERYGLFLEGERVSNQALDAEVVVVCEPEDGLWPVAIQREGGTRDD